MTTASTNMKMGPNNASGIIWAICKSFFFLFFIFFKVLTIINVCKGWGHLGLEGRHDVNGPGRRQTCRSGPS